MEGAFFGGGFWGADAAVVEEFGEPGGGAPAGAAGLDDGEERLGDGVEAGFGDLLGELLVALHGVEQCLMMDAELGGGLAEREAVDIKPRMRPLARSSSLMGRPRRTRARESARFGC